MFLMFKTFEHTFVNDDDDDNNNKVNNIYALKF